MARLTEDQRRTARQALQGLPLRSRTIFTLAYVERMSTAEIAETVDLPEPRCRLILEAVRRYVLGVLRTTRPTATLSGEVGGAGGAGGHDGIGEPD